LQPLLDEDELDVEDDELAAADEALVDELAAALLLELDVPPLPETALPAAPAPPPEPPAAPVPPDLAPPAAPAPAAWVRSFVPRAQPGAFAVAASASVTIPIVIQREGPIGRLRRILSPGAAPAPRIFHPLRPCPSKRRGFQRHATCSHRPP
jgi:hypothetical protein